MKSIQIQKWLPWFLLIGAALRLVWGVDMEYKTDEAWMFRQAIHVGRDAPWPWLGVSSGVYLRNPGMSVWLFVAIARLTGVQDPVDLARCVQYLSIAALLLGAYFALKKSQSDPEREPWLWGIALACVNPFMVLYHRKIWAQSALPFFSMLFLILWCRKHTRGTAFFLGLLGACLGQIHMSGFFYAAAFALWALIFELRKTRWKAWLLGSVIGAAPLIPWFFHLWEHVHQPSTHSQTPLVFGWVEAVQLKFWVFWMSDAFGLHLGNALGVRNGNSAWIQLREFFPEPRILGYPTYLVALAHLGIVLLALAWMGRLLLQLGRPRAFQFRDKIPGVIWPALIGYGLLLTCATVAIRRYYLLITFPLEFVFIAATVLMFWPKKGRKLLFLLALAQILVSVSFLYFVHRNGGSIQGDYGPSYRSQGEPDRTSILGR